MRSPRLRFRHLIISFLYCSTSNAVCYWPNGDPTSQDIACRDDSDNSACCPPGFACLDNGLCIVTPHVEVTDNVSYIRGSCTDKTWKSSDCPNYCMRGDAPWQDSLNDYQVLVKCNSTEYFCGDSMGGSCTTGENTFIILPEDPVATLTTIGFPETTTLTSTLESTSTYHISSSSMATTTSMSSHTPISQISPSSAATIVASKQGPNPETVGLGAGLGVPFGLLSLGLVGWLLFKKRRRTAKAGQTNRPISELPVEEAMSEAPQPKQWRREELSGESWAPSEMPADP